METVTGAARIDPTEAVEIDCAAPSHGIALPDLELACAPISLKLGQRYLGAMRAPLIHLKARI